jgi:anti-anti-sigma factor
MHLSHCGDSGIAIRVTVAGTIVELLETGYGSTQQLAIARVENVLLRLANEPKVYRVIVDLSRVKFLGASLIGVLVNARYRLQRRGRRLVLCGLSPACARLARVMHLERLFEIFPTRRMALWTAMRSTSNLIDRHATILIRMSDVNWDPNKVRLSYVTENDSVIYTRIVPW